MNFEEQVKQKLQDLTRKQQVAFAWRCAIRALPFLGYQGNFDFWKKEDRQKYLYSIFYAIDIGKTNANTKVDVALAVETHRAANTVIPFNTITSHSNTIINTIYTINSVVNLDAINAANDAINAAIRVDIDLTSIILEDLQAIKNQQPFTISTILYGEIWDNFQTALKKEGCDYWADLYQGLFYNNFALDEEALERRLNVPEEIREQGAAAVGRYLTAFKTGAERLNEARILILGDKGAGKTCVARRLKNPQAEMTTDEESTAGVDTIIWQPKGYEMNIRIWDFAGHTVTHAVHQFFLSERCLYIIVYNGRTEDRSRLEYWLDHMKNYGGDSEAIILVNERDRHRAKLSINRLKEKYAIDAFYSFNVKDDIEKLKAFQQYVADYIQNKPSWKNQEIPTSYYQVKEALEKRFNPKGQKEGEEYISKADFMKIATQNEVQEPEKLLQDLHFLGVSLWYKDIDEVETLVLNPEWISQGVYTIINWASNAKMYSLSLDCFAKVFEGQLDRYPPKKHAFLFELMKRYELAYETTHKRLIIPHLLEEDQPEKLPVFPIGESLMLKYEADQPLPPHTISRFIVRHNQLIKEEKGEALVWRYGVILEDGKGSLALVRELDRTIEVSIKGATKTDFITTLRDTLNDIFNSYKSKRPSLKYRIERHGEIVPLRNTPQDLWLTEQEIVSHQAVGRPYFDSLTQQELSLDKDAKSYNITHQHLYMIRGNENVLLGGQGHQITKNVFNFDQCNLDLQGNLTELARKLKKEGNMEDAEEITEAVEVLEEIKKGATKEEVQKKGILPKLKRILKDLGDDQSTLGKTVKGVRNGIGIAQDIAKGYNEVAQWVGLPQVPKPFLKKDEKG